MNPIEELYPIAKQNAYFDGYKTRMYNLDCNVPSLSCFPSINSSLQETWIDGWTHADTISRQFGENCFP